MDGQVSVSVANLYREPSFRSEVISQGILGEHLTILNVENTFSLVRLPDQYEGWLNNHQWIEQKKMQGSYHRLRSHFTHIHQEPDQYSLIISEAVVGTYLAVIDTKDGWSEIVLPDQQRGWVRTASLGTFPRFSRESVVDLALEFLGSPYIWGGRSVKGFDCSGFTQCVFALLGKSLPRDSWMQQKSTALSETDPLKARKADLYFFAESGNKITHVGISLGNAKIIHARGMVRINSMNPDDYNYMHDLTESFIDVRTVFNK